MSGTPEPVAQMVYAPGDYNHAVQCYLDAQEWVMKSGVCSCEDLRGVLHHPQHPLCPASSRTVPVELMDEGGWSVTVDFCCGPETLAWLQTLPVPPAARFVVLPERLDAESGASQ